ncbi:MAG: hypothetical protein GC185_08070 [Alphaproteobacteria bacterium]|nr:hypothetical protein [Alphaproteobacteria bacterium]
MSTNDKEKSYQDGLYGQVYNGRNWDQYSAGQLMARDMAKNKSGGVDYTPKANAGTGGASGGGIFVILALVFAVVGIVVTIASALIAIVVAPVLSFTLHMLGLPSPGVRRIYVATFQAVAGYALCLSALFILVDIIGHHFPPLMGLAQQIDALYYGITQHRWDIINTGSGAFFTLSVPALWVFVFMLRRNFAQVFAGPQGFLRGALVGLSAVPVSAGVLYAALKMFVGH